MKSYSKSTFAFGLISGLGLGLVVSRMAMSAQTIEYGMALVVGGSLIAIGLLLARFFGN